MPHFFTTTHVTPFHSEKTKMKSKQDLPNMRYYALQHRNRYILTRDGLQFINHSCDPNAWYVGNDIMAARRDIQ